MVLLAKKNLNWQSHTFSRSDKKTIHNQKFTFKYVKYKQNGKDDRMGGLIDVLTHKLIVAGRCKMVCKLEKKVEAKKKQRNSLSAYKVFIHRE